MNDSRISRCHSFIQFVGSHTRTMTHVQYNLGGTLPLFPLPLPFIASHMAGNYTAPSGTSSVPHPCGLLSEPYYSTIGTIVGPSIIYSYLTSDDSICNVSFENVRQIIITGTLWNILKYIRMISHRNDLPFLSVTKKPDLGPNC